MNAYNDTIADYLDHLRMALAQGSRSVCPIVKAALGAGCTKEQLFRVAAEVGPHYAKEAIRNALGQISPHEISTNNGRTEGDYAQGLHHSI
jgi:hypothetical protein